MTPFTEPLYRGATPLPKLLQQVAAELRGRAKNVRVSADFRALVLSAECDKQAAFLTQTQTPAPE